MSIDIETIKRLKELTGVGLTDAKSALEASNGDFDKALKEMRKKGLTKAEKRGEREARAGVIGTYNHDSRIGVVIEVNCETDFVARNDIFKDLVKDLAMQVAASSPKYIKVEDVPKKDIDELSEEIKSREGSKPKEILKKVLSGQLQKHYEEVCLLEQPFIKEPEKKVNDIIQEHIAKLGENIVVKRFNRLALGEIS